MHRPRRSESLPTPDEEMHVLDVKVKQLKLDYEQWDDDFDRLNLLFGYVF